MSSVWKNASVKNRRNFFLLAAICGGAPFLASQYKKINRIFKSTNFVAGPQMFPLNTQETIEKMDRVANQPGRNRILHQFNSTHNMFSPQKKLISMGPTEGMTPGHYVPKGFITLTPDPTPKVEYEESDVDPEEFIKQYLGSKESVQQQQ